MGGLYRDRLVQQIKDSGQELIDLAEKMVGQGLDAITGFTISICLSPDGQDKTVPCITWETSVLNKKILERDILEQIELYADGELVSPHPSGSEN